MPHSKFFITKPLVRYDYTILKQLVDRLSIDDIQVLDKEMDRVFKVIEKNVDSQGMIVFSRLVKESDSAQSIVRTFIPCLFLTNKGRINMWQDVFFGEIFISLSGQAPVKNAEVA